MRTIGNQLGMDGGAEAVHYLLERDPRSPAFAHDFAAMVPVQRPQPAVRRDPRVQLRRRRRDRWSSERVEPDDFRGDSLLLTGEHLFPWHFEDSADLRPYREVAEILADHPWPRLYDADVLAEVDVPCAAAIYADDPFVDRTFSEQTADLFPGCAGGSPTSTCTTACAATAGGCSTGSSASREGPASADAAAGPPAG